MEARTDNVAKAWEHWLSIAPRGTPRSDASAPPRARSGHFTKVKRFISRFAGSPAAPRMPTPAEMAGRTRSQSRPAAKIKDRFQTMDRPATHTPATAREIILEIVRNMRDGLEPLHYSTLAPSLFHVYLHPDDMERLRGILPRIVEEARRALDAELESLNRASLGSASASA